MNIKGILFDFGGTIDTNGIHWCEMLRMVYQKCEIKLPDKAYDMAYLYAEDQLNTNVKINPDITYNHMLAKKVNLQLNFLKEKGYLNEYHDIDTLIERVNTTSYSTIVSIIKKQIEILILLKNKYILGLVSNFYGNMETVLKEFGLSDYFSCVVDSALIGIRKPDPAIWEKGVKLLGLNASEVAVIGDSYLMDILPAKSLGCKTIWLEGKSWCASPDDISAADKIIHSLDEIKFHLLD